EWRDLFHWTLRIAFSSYNEKATDKRMDEVIGIEFTRGIIVRRIGKEELHQLLRRRVFKIGSEPQFACWSMIQLQIDAVHERKVERTSNHLEITSRAYHWTDASRHER